MRAIVRASRREICAIGGLFCLDDSSLRLQRQAVIPFVRFAEIWSGSAIIRNANSVVTGYSTLDSVVVAARCHLANCQVDQEICNLAFRDARSRHETTRLRGIAAVPLSRTLTA